MSTRGPRLEFAVGAFLVLALGSLLVLAIASTNGRFGMARDSYALTARFTQIGQLRPNAPVKIGGVTVGRVSGIDLDPVKFDSIVTLAIDGRFAEIPIDTSAGILTGGLLGESYVGLQVGGDMEVLKPGEEIVFTTPAVDLMQMVGKYMFSGGGDDAPAATAPGGQTPDDSGETAPQGEPAPPAIPAPEQGTTP
ncbi:outer membrane lipid asymmetry maintenance protein MlaD [Luteimonas kalidii]|uniref:Outer membrane lipid asymmetry maintenance protein MlaD n=1 Tax=Luteimonas kalidii TaxID=3042025 RepID=A0ABT6JRH0_9GAMM|nr:outer membrane lipid asymmetry maintenance protein MlaD [Luteimonas kalidii]MDH5833288.1 outer membrane lipid asymmetry maintenance protein MlaD [Luteimonas kalidii]